jgi:hypothetical protein
MLNPNTAIQELIAEKEKNKILVKALESITKVKLNTDGTSKARRSPQ